MDVHIKSNHWNNIFCVGNLPDFFYKEIQHMPFTFAVADADEESYEVEDAVPYYPNIIVIVCRNFDEFDATMQKVTKSLYWYPLSNLVLYYNEKNRINVAKAFFVLWYYRVTKAIIIDLGNNENTITVHKYSPFVNKYYKLFKSYGCWTAKPLGFPLDAVCVDHCTNVTLNSTIRGENLGTCIGIDTIQVPYGDSEIISKLNLFEDKAKNLHKFAFTANVIELAPFLTIDENEDGSYSLGSRDGVIWNTLSQLMNFTIDLSPSISVMKKPFNSELSVQQIFSLSLRKVDLFLNPIYQYDFTLMNIDYIFPFKESGMCFVSHLANFETILFDINLLKTRYDFFIQFAICFVGVWFVTYMFSVSETGHSNVDQIGKDFLNAIRNVLLISLHKPPKGQSFRIFLATTIWSFFILSFSSQAMIIAVFTAIKRGNEVETFDDIIGKGYPIEVVSSPDLLLPEDEDRYRIIRSRIVPTEKLLSCVEKMKNDSKRFCVIDCSVGRYLERNMLDDNGEQYLHIPQDRIHSYYLNVVLQKHSLMSEMFNKYIMSFFEAGLIRKWEQYRYNVIKADTEIKPLGINDLIGLFNLYFFCLGCVGTIFFLELVLGGINKVKNLCSIIRKRVK